MNILLRRLQKFSKIIKLATILLSSALIAYTIINYPPTIILILFVSILLTICLLTFFPAIISLSIGFLIFLKAVDLLSPVNLLLWAVFILLLGLFLRKK